MPNKMRTIAAMPRAVQSIFSRIWPPLIFATLVFVISCPTARIHCHSKGEAAPMAGDCKNIQMNRYVGDGDQDGKVCDWGTRKYWCFYDPKKEIWQCDAIEPQAEKK